MKKTKLLWNRELKKLGAGFLLLFLAGAAAVNAGIGIFGNQIYREYKGLLSVMFGNVITVYPNVEEDELIRILFGQENREEGEVLLARYGVFEAYGEEAFLPQEGRLRLLAVRTNFFLLLVFCFCGIFLLRYFRKRQKKIFDLEQYMEILNREGYRMEMKENEDDELSGLRNEIYKLTVALKEQAVRSEEQKSLLADAVADISHQLKTPLTSTTILLDNLSEDEDMDPVTRRRFLSEITYQLTGMSWLITVMLKLSRLDAGVVEMERTKLSVSGLVEEAVRRVEVAAEWNDISFRLEIPKETMLYCDGKWTAEALTNLLKNALEHSPQGNCVEIGVSENDIYTQITVRDHGKGISGEEQKKLFSRFYRGSTAREDSVGIGLALAKEIVEKQGGYITVDSREGAGTCFTIKFMKGFCRRDREDDK